MDTQNPFRILSTILLLGASACIDEGAEELLDEELAAIELEELELELAELELTELELQQLPGAGPDEIASNEPDTTPVNAVQPLRSDFNGDGFADLAMGAPGRMVGGVDSGAVIVSYGSPLGVNAPGGIAPPNQLLTILNAPGGVPNSQDEFGAALAAGDFNFDGFADLAIGAPRYDLPGGTDQGAVMIIYGSPTGLGLGAGLTTPVNQLMTQGFLAGAGDRYGAALAAHDFDGDADFDLAVGVPGEDFPGAAEAGRIHVYRGNPGLTGMAPLPAQTIDQTSLVMFPPGINTAQDRFGEALAAGDFDGDGTHDLAIGAPGEDWGAVNDVGAVTVLYGMAGPGGPLHLGGIPGETPPQVWQQHLLPGQVSQQDDEFGSALVAANFDGNPFDDLAVGVPYEDVGAATNAGAVTVIYAKNALGLGVLGAQQLTQNSVVGGVPIFDVAAQDDNFGKSLAAGDIIFVPAGPGAPDGYDDLVVGVPGEDLGGLADAGLIHIIRSAAAAGIGLEATGNVTRTRFGLLGGGGFNEAEAAFGSALAIGDYNGNGVADLAVGSPLKDNLVPAIKDAGEVIVKLNPVVPLFGGQTLTTTLMGLGTTPSEQLGKALPTAH